ncbi:MAG TPA: protein BatD [Desulfocapsa sulfexigens]|nr:protein BatD [Desulfocapsa sulfexigens]
MKIKKYFQKNNAVVVLCFLLLFLFAGTQSLRAAVEISASLNANSFPLDRAGLLSIQVTGVRSFEPQLPEVDGLQFYHRGQSTQVEIINGAYSASVTSTYLVQASRVGKFTIPAIRIKTETGEAKTEPINFEVTASNSSPVPQTGRSSGSSTARLRSGNSDEVAFLRVKPAKKESYSGEVVPVQIKVYFREGIKANLNSLPLLTGEGFVLQQLESEPVQSREFVNNTQYTVLTWNSSLSGIKEGAHKLSVELEATLLLREQRRISRRGNSMFNDPFFDDSFFDNFFGSYREKEVKIASPEFDLTVLPLPEDERPENFSGAIGDFRLHVKADPVELSPGDPITLTMTVSGQGNFDRVQAPKLSSEQGWKSYTPSSEFLKDGGPGHGKKVFEQALVAKDSTLSEIPAVEFSYFDPATASYKTLASSPIPLKIKGMIEKKESEPVKENIEKKKVEKALETGQKTEPPISTLAPLQLAPGSMDQSIEPLYGKKWFQLLALFILLVLSGATIFKLRATRLANNPLLQRNQAMKHLLTLRLKEIEDTLSANDTRKFLAACRGAIQEQLGLAWETEAAAITLADLEKRLPVGSVLVEIFRAAEESAYGGQELSSAQGRKFAEALKQELEGL